MFNAPEFKEAFDGRPGGSGSAITSPAPAPAPAPTPAPNQGSTQAPKPTPSKNVLDFDTAREWNGAVIKDFMKGDVIDFRDIDANVRQSGHQSFEFLGFVGSRAFTTDGAEIRVRHHQGDTYIYLNTDNDRSYEAKGMIEGIHQLTVDDFLL